MDKNLKKNNYWIRKIISRITIFYFGKLTDNMFYLTEAN